MNTTINVAKNKQVGKPQTVTEEVKMNPVNEPIVIPTLVPLSEQLKEEVVGDVPKNEEEILKLEAEINTLKEQLKEKVLALRKLNGEAKKADKEPSKMDLAKSMYYSMAGSQRKDVIAAFMNEIGLTKAGASTYYQILFSKDKQA
jgi:hypothetical protein